MSNFFEICYKGDIKEFENTIENGENNWNWGLCGACYGGHIAIVNLMIKKGADDWNNGLYGACRGGHIELVQLMIEKGANDWNEELKTACDIVDMKLVKLGSNKGLYRGERMELVQLMTDDVVYHWKVYDSKFKRVFPMFVWKHYRKDKVEKDYLEIFEKPSQNSIVDIRVKLFDKNIANMINFSYIKKK